MAIQDGYVQTPAGYFKLSDGSGPYSISSAGAVTLIGPGPVTLAAGTASIGSISNLPVTVNTPALISAAGATTSLTGDDWVNADKRGAKVVLDMTAVGTGSVTLTIQGKDAVSGKYYTLLAGAAVTTNSTNVYEVYPGVTAVANVSASTALPRTWRVSVTANNANPTTYTVGASILV